MRGSSLLSAADVIQQALKLSVRQTTAEAKIVTIHATGTATFPSAIVEALTVVLRHMGIEWDYIAGSDGHTVTIKAKAQPGVACPQKEAVQ